MKIKCLVLLIGISITNCLILNPVGLNVDREKGSEAADRIRQAAITADLTNSLILSGGRTAGISILSLIADDIAGIDPAKYYVKSDVDSCVKEIKGLTGFVLGSAIANILSCQNLKKDGYLTGEPLPVL
ncbi:TIGR04452 family lipoprotein [Leptospira sp. 'Mane']|uniref:TIGR04452 family lipoprotein n=1 Tax=Leptospira sp. 'Mane' TaxID=3387407 RepID=UPI00398B7047